MSILEFFLNSQQLKVDISATYFLDIKSQPLLSLVEDTTY